MSNHVSSLVRSHKLGVGLTGKSVILLMADFASDDGTGIWASKPTMAKELETTDRTIQRTIKALMDAGFVMQVGKRTHRNGETYEYKIVLEAVSEMPLAKSTPPTQRHPSTQNVEPETQDIAPDTVSPPTACHPTPDRPSPHGVTHRHPNQSKPSKEPSFMSVSLKDEFDLFWAEVPKKVAKPKARAAFKAALKKKSAAEIITAMRRYAATRLGQDEQFTAHPASWLNAERWDDEQAGSKADPETAAKLNKWNKLSGIEQ